MILCAWVKNGVILGQQKRSNNIKNYLLLSMKDIKEIKERIEDLNNRIDFYLSYAQDKIEGRDWHGIEDSRLGHRLTETGLDIRDLETEKRVLLWVLEE